MTEGMVAPIVYRPRRGLSHTEAALYIGVSTGKFDELVKAGTMPKPLHIGSRVIWDMRQLDSAFDALLTTGDQENSWADFEGASQVR